MIYTSPVAGNLPIETLVARIANTHTCTCNYIMLRIRIHSYSGFVLRMQENRLICVEYAHSARQISHRLSLERTRLSHTTMSLTLPLSSTTSMIPV